MLIRIALAIRAHLIDHILGRGQMVDRTPSVCPADDVGELVGWRLGRHFYGLVYPLRTGHSLRISERLRPHTATGTTADRSAVYGLG